MSCLQTIRLATRGSALALAQARRVAGLLAAHTPALRVELVTIRTLPDRHPHTPLHAFGDKGVFVREVEEAVVAGRADAAVHSLKDLPAELTPGFEIAAIPERLSPADLLISAWEEANMDTLPSAARIATSSLRRRGQLLHYRPDVQVVEMRGNVDTRLRKLLDGEADALILAKAGLERLEAIPMNARELPPELMLPAACQGAIAIEVLAESPWLPLLSQLDDSSARLACETERAFVRAIGADCRTPVACLCVVGESTVRLHAAVCTPDGTRLLRFEREAPCEAASELAREAAKSMLACGARAIMDQARSAPPTGGIS
ncbi:MAG: hydroxymethylbilane synthase [Candidatus Sumerlaeaceae bacterium]